MRPVRRSIRLRDYDYSQGGAYFVTVVSKNRELLFQNEALRTAVEDAWRWLERQYAYVELDQFIVMPNHVHGIIVIHDALAGGSRAAPTRRKPLGQLIGAFKTVSAKRANMLRGTPGQPLWQRNYYEHVVRDEADLNRVRQYIADNPARWEYDRENPGVGAARGPPVPMFRT